MALSIIGEDRATPETRAARHLPAIVPVLFFVAIAAAALTTRFVLLAAKSFWLDEAWSWRSANISFHEMLSITSSAQDTHPPGYFVVLHLFVNVAGNSPTALRAPSAIAGAASIVLIAFVAWRASGWFAAAAAAVLLTLNAAFLDISQEVRMYPLVSLLALASSLLLGEYLARPRVAILVGYAALASGLLYVDYSGLMVLAIHAMLITVYGAVRLRGEHRADILIGGAAGLAAAFGGWLPWLPAFMRQLPKGAPLPEVTGEVVRNVTHAAMGLNYAGALWIPLTVLLLGTGVFGVIRRLRDRRLIAVAALALVPVAQIAISVVDTPVFALRQVSPYIPALMLVAALGVDECRRFILRSTGTAGYIAGPALGVLATMLVIVMTVAMIEKYHESSREDWRGAAAEVSATNGPSYIWRRYTSVPLSYYLRGLNDIRFANGAGPEGIDVDLAQDTRPSGSQALLILSHDTPDETNALLVSFSKHFDVTPVRGANGGVRMYRLRVR